MLFQEMIALLRSAKFPEDIFGTGITAETCKKVYHKLARQVHPDRHRSAKGKADATEGFALLSKFYEEAERKFAAGTYGDKAALTKTIKITTKENVYEVRAKLTTGALTTVYDATDDHGRSVLLKVPRQPSSNLWMRQEALALKTVREKITGTALHHLPDFMYTFELQQGATRKQVNVFSKSGEECATWADIIKVYPRGIHILDATWMINRILAALATVHQCGFVHGAVTPDNLLIFPKSHNGILLDWTAMVKAGTPIPYVHQAYRGYYPPEVLEKKPASSGTDMYMLASSILALVGGNVAAKSFPAWLTGQLTDARIRVFKGLLRVCWLNVNRRSNNAMELYSELAEITSPRKFRVFTMPKR
jgi:serine/threonine protein kinase